VLGVLPIPAAAASGSRLTVDWTRCEAHGLCAHILPEVVSLDTNGYPAIVDRPVPDWLYPQARKAVGMCPALALRMTNAVAGRAHDEPDGGSPPSSLSE
jgi:ferredoxin